MTSQLEAVRFDLEPVREDMRQLARTVNLLVSDSNRRASEYTPKSITSSTTLDDNYTVILANCTSGAIIITLPLAINYKGRFFYIKKIDASANNLTIDGNGSETIDGQLTAVISVQYTCLTIYSDGTEWWII